MAEWWLAALAPGVLCCGLGALLLRQWQRLGCARETLQRLEIEREEALRLQKAEQQLAQAQQISETAVAGGTEVVRAVHRGIAAIPFTILEAIPVTRDTTRVVRKTHDLISDAVYGSIRAVNRGVGVQLRRGLQEAPRDGQVVATTDDRPGAVMSPVQQAGPAPPTEPPAMADDGSAKR